MSVSLILASGFLFLGGIAMYVIDPYEFSGWFGVLLAVMGAIPLVICWFQEFIPHLARLIAPETLEKNPDTSKDDK